MDKNIIDVDMSEYEDAPEMPEECPESEEAIEEISRRSLNDKYTFINVIVLAIAVIGCAAYFISMTSSKRYGDEGNKFSIERLANGKYTAEISKRYYSSIAYPEGIKELSEKLTRLYGITEGKPSEEVLDPDEMQNEPGSEVTGTSDSRGGHDEKEVTTAGTDEKGEEKKQSKTTSATLEKYATKFYHTTTTEETEPEDDSEEETTTTNNNAPSITSTTTEKATEWTHKETNTQSQTKATPADTGRVTEDTSSQSPPPEDSSSEPADESSEAEPDAGADE